MANRFLEGVTVVSMLLVAGVARSQEEPTTLSPIAVGSRVRVIAPSVATGRIVGMVVHLDEKALLVDGGDHTRVSVPRQAITRFDVSTGHHRHTLTGTCIGAGLGAVLGAAYPCFAMVGCDPSNRASAALVYGLAGAAYGAGIGALIKHESWSAVSLDRVHVTLAPTPGGGVGLSMALSF